jgi:hypothetical protein
MKTREEIVAVWRDRAPMAELGPFIAGYRAAESEGALKRERAWLVLGILWVISGALMLAEICTR